MTLEVLNDRLDMCPSDMTSTGDFALRWREGKDGIDTCPAAWGSGQHINPIYHIPNCKIILNKILKLLKTSENCSPPGEKNLNITYIFTHNALLIVSQP